VWGLKRPIIIIIIIIIIIKLLEKYSLQFEWVGNGSIHIELCWQKKLGKRPLGEDRIWETNFRKVNCVDVKNGGEGTTWGLRSGMDGVEI
jgi:hypothetical protein